MAGAYQAGTDFGIGFSGENAPARRGLSRSPENRSFSLQSWHVRAFRFSMPAGQSWERANETDSGKWPRSGRLRDRARQGVRLNFVCGKGSTRSDRQWLAPSVRQPLPVAVGERLLVSFIKTAPGKESACVATGAILIGVVGREQQPIRPDDRDGTREIVRAEHAAGGHVQVAAQVVGDRMLEA